MKNHFLLALTALFLTTSLAGCATTSTHKTTTTETTVQTPADAAEPHMTIVEESRTTTTTNTETEPQHRGIIGGLFHVIGSIIAFPFIVIGNVFRAIF